MLEECRLWLVDNSVSGKAERMVWLRRRGDRARGKDENDGNDWA
jgi:hypothetical protein